MNSLSDYIKDQVAAYDKPESCDELIQLAISIDVCFQERLREKDDKSQRFPVSGFMTAPGEPRTNTVFAENCKTQRHLSFKWSTPTTSPVNCLLSLPEPEPMQVGDTRLSPEERKRHKDPNVYIYCGNVGHYLINCPCWGNESAHQ